MASDNEGRDQAISEETGEGVTDEPCCCFNVRTVHRHEFIYVLVFKGDIIKIGRSADPSTRVAQHIAATSLQLDGGYLFAVLDSRKAEEALLDFFHNFRLNGAEWFVIPKESRAEFKERERFILNGVAFWPHCAHLSECSLCNALHFLETSEQTNGRIETTILDP